MPDSVPPPGNGGTEHRLRAVEQGMFVLLGSLQYPGGEIKEIHLEFTDLREELGPRLDKVLQDWVASPAFSTTIAKTVVVVLAERRSSFAKAIRKPLVQIAVGVLSTVFATMLILYFVHAGVVIR